MNKSRVVDICSQYGLSPIKKLGQNFLIDDGITAKIIDSVAPCRDDRILEIGPGLGALTDGLIKKAGSVTAIEIDAGIVKTLEERFKREATFSLIHGDFLKIDISNTYNKVVSNLPYYCSSEILFRIALEMPGVDNVFVMLQKEMAERITSQPGTKIYGALTVNLGLYFTFKTLFKVSSGCFYPRPDVSSLFLRLIRKKEIPFGDEMKRSFHDIVKSAFWGRRKTILTSLVASPHVAYSKNDVITALEASGISQKVRGEDLGLEEYITLTKNLYGKINS